MEERKGGRGREKELEVNRKRRRWETGRGERKGRIGWDVKGEWDGRTGQAREEEVETGRGRKRRDV